jgi:hypothetical protein
MVDDLALAMSRADKTIRLTFDSRQAQKVPH